MNKAITLDQLEQSMIKVTEKLSSGGGGIKLSEYIEYVGANLNTYSANIACKDQILISPIDNQYDYSMDYGIHWETKQFPVAINGTSICSTNDGFCACGSDGIALVSSDGISWTKYTHPLSFTDSFGMIKCVSSGNTIVCAKIGIGSASKANFAYSTDGGKTWSSTTNPASSIFVDFSYSNRHFIGITSSGNITYSKDGISWSNHSTILSGNGWEYIHGTYSAGFIVSSEGKCARIRGTSTLKFTEQSIQTISPLGIFCYSSSSYVIFCKDFILYSKDCVTWSQYPLGNEVNYAIHTIDLGSYNNIRYLAKSSSAIFLSNDLMHWSRSYVKFVDDSGIDITKQIAAAAKLYS